MTIYLELKRRLFALGYRLERKRMRSSHQSSQTYLGYRIVEPPGPGSTALLVGTLWALELVVERLERQNVLAN